LAATAIETKKKKHADDAAERVETAKAVAEEQKKRRSLQDKALADADKAAEAAAIAAASEMTQSEAAREPKLREIGAQATKILLEKAREAEEKLARTKIIGISKNVDKASTQKLKSAREKSKPIKKDTSRFSIGSRSVIKKKLSSSPKKVEAADKTFFGSRPAMKKFDSSSSSPKKVEASTDKPFWLQLLEKAQGEDDTTAPAKESRASAKVVSPLKKKPAPKQKKKPAPKQEKKPAPKQVKKPLPKQVKKPLPKQKKKPAPKEKKIAPAQKKSWGTFTIKNSQGKDNKLASTTETKPVKKKESFSFFGNKSTPKKELKVSTPAKAVTPAKKNPFGNKSKPKKESKVSTPTKAVTPAKKNPFGWGTRPVKEKQSTLKVDAPFGKKSTAKPARKKSNTLKVTPAKSETSSGNDFFSFLKSKPAENGVPKSIDGKKKKFVAPAKPALKDGIPIISNWEREADGSITGKISNSPNFRNGEVITTSPARGVAKSGKVVVTGSGSKYRLGDKR